MKLPAVVLLFAAAAGMLAAQSFAMGADVSSLELTQQLGAKFFDENGIAGDPLSILQRHGVSFIRLRVWVNPADGVNNQERVVRLARKARALGLRLLVDFHYSDTWADPGHQAKPAAWANDDFPGLQKDLYDHTYGVCASLKAAGAGPDMVQIGNEINGGMLWPDGSSSSWPRLAALLSTGYRAVKDCSPAIQVMLHLAGAGDKAAAEKWFDSARARGVHWDVIGLSYYSYWNGGMSAMTDTVRDLRTRYGVPVVIVETAYPFTLENADAQENVIHSRGQLAAGYPATPQGQAGNLRDVIAAARAGGAAGVFYWEPTWTAVRGSGWDPADPASGDGWENQALFDFHGRALPALEDFGR